MATHIGKSYTSRHNIPYNKIPTVKGPMFGNSIPRYSILDYGCILDAVFDMVDAVSNGNGVSPESAMNTVMKDDSIYILPSHREMICDLLKD